MAVHVSIVLHKEVEDIDKGNDFIEVVKELLQGKVTASIQSRISNSSPSENLTEVT